MTSLAHDRLLEQGSAPKNGVRTAPATARTTTARRRAGAAEEPAAEPRTRTAQRSTTTRTTGDPRPSTRTTAAKKPAPAKPAPAKAAPAKAAPAKATAKAAKAAPTKAVTAKAAPAKSTKAPVKPATKPAQSTSAKPAKPATAKPAQVKSAPRRTAAATAASEAAPARRRPIPRPRPASDTEVVAETPVVEVVEVVADELEPAPVAEPSGRRRWFRRRPALSIAAALVGAVALSTAVVSTEAQAETTTNVSESVSVAKQLGISSSEAQLSPDAAGAELRQMVVSRNERSSEQAHAALVQSRADKAVQQRRAVAAAEAARPQAVLPVKGAKYTSCFCARWGTFHYGIDLAAPIGTPEYAAMDGVVLEAGPASGFGLAVYIQHANGDVTVYGHMEQILVKAGQVVRAGDTIALLGNRGQSTGPHLHFEVHVGGINGQKVDPIPWLAARGVHV